MASPYGFENANGLKFCPTGGISYDTASHFLALPNVVCVGGSWLAPKEAVEARNWDEISHLARAASELARHGGAH